MKKVIRLTESDLMRIVKRVISEELDSNKPKVIHPTTCSELNKFNGKSVGLGWKFLKAELTPNKKEESGDIYSYGELWNGKICYCVVGKEGFAGPNSKWFEATDNKQKMAINNALYTDGLNYEDNLEYWKSIDK